MVTVRTFTGKCSIWVREHWQYKAKTCLERGLVEGYVENFCLKIYKSLYDGRLIYYIPGDI